MLRKIRIPILPLLFAFVFLSCASYKADKQARLLSIPELGTIVKLKGDLLYSAAAQIGTPSWESLPVSAQDLPFNEAKFATYSQMTLRAGKMGSVAFSDSLRYKPKFVRLQLRDKIGLTEILNNEQNRGLREYLEHDSDHKLISSLDVALTEQEIPLFVLAQALQLQKDAFGNIILVVFSGNEEYTYYFSELPVFDFDYVSFCWGQDRYDRRIVENLADKGDKCPKGTHLKPHKLKADAVYTKF